VEHVSGLQDLFNLSGMPHLVTFCTTVTMLFNYSHGIFDLKKCCHFTELFISVLNNVYLITAYINSVRRKIYVHYPLPFLT